MESGERLAIPERVIVAPASGRFRPAWPERDGGPGDEAAPAAGGDALDAQQVIGFVDGSGHSIPVLSPFAGFLMGLLAHAGERVREGQPVAWLRLA